VHLPRTEGEGGRAACPPAGWKNTMAIRFSCPACQQPLEIDDNWAGQSVACPYCRRVVNAPQASTWPGSDVPMAAPGWPADPHAQPQQQQPPPGFGPPPTPGYGQPPAPGFGPPPAPGFPAPPPPPGYGPPTGYGPPMGYAPRAGSSAVWALCLSILGALMIVGLTMAWALLLSKSATEALGSSASQAEIQKYVEDAMRQGNMPHRQGLALTGALAMIASIGGLVLAVRALVRRESGRGMAIAACILGGIFLFCQFIMEMMFIAARAAT
jgi:hypothetical protein